jgi:hypothetical protein
MSTDRFDGTLSRDRAQLEKLRGIDAADSRRK